MAKVQIPTERFGGKVLRVVLVSVLFLTTALSSIGSAQTKEEEDAKTVRGVAQYFIDAGNEHYRRGQYSQAEKLFLQALEYESYLTAATRTKLNELVEKSRKAPLARKGILEHIQAADKLIQQGQLATAKPHLERVKASEFLTEDERKQVTAGLEELNRQLRRGYEKPPVGEPVLPKPTREWMEEYAARTESDMRRPPEPLPLVPTRPRVEFPKTGLAAIGDEQPRSVEIGREGRLPMIQEPTGYPAAGYAPAPVPVSDVRTGDGSYIQKVVRMRNIRRRYIETLVNDVNENVPTYVNQGEFDKANGVVEAVRRAVNEFRLDLGDTLFKQYSGKLQELSDYIAAQKAQADTRIARIKEIEARGAQAKFRIETERARKKRVDDLMTNVSWRCCLSSSR
jgi:hypothetical protein